MAIKIYLPYCKIKDQEDTTIIKNFTQIFANKGANLKEIKINDIKNNDKLVVVELENLDDEKQIVEKISGMKIFNDIELKPKIYHQIQITNISISYENEKIKKQCKEIVSCNDTAIKIKDYKDSPSPGKIVYIDLDSRESAEKLINNLNNQEWDGKKIKVGFAKDKSTKKTTQQSNTTEPNLTNVDVENFYKDSDYDLVNQNLRTFIYEICKYLSVPVINQENISIEKLNNNKDKIDFF